MDRYIRIYKESDFDFQYKLDSAHLSTPFKFIFFTTDINESSYECSFDGTTYYRCTRVDEDSIVFHIDGNTFECGNLRIRKEYFIDSSSFEDGICNSVDVEKTNVYIIEEGSNANSVVYCGSTLPNFDPMLIEQNVERAIIILNEKSDEVDQQLSYVILVKDEMEGLLSYATEWEDRIENIESTYATQSYVQNKIDSIDFSSYPTFTDISNMGYLTSIPSEYITQEELSSNGYLTQHQSLSNYPTFTDINNMGYATQTYVQDKINDIPSPDLSAYATKSYVVDYVATYAPVPDLSTYATKSYVVDYVATYAPQPDLSPYPTYSYTNKVYVTYSYLDDVVQDIVVGHVDLRDYVKKEDLDEAGYISSIPSEYITQEELSANAYLTQHQSLDGYATESYVVNYVATYAPEPDLSSYATKSYVVDYVATYAPQPDLSSYVTKTELSNAGYITYIPDDYITQLELSSNSYATEAYVVDYVATYAPLPDLSSYVTYSYLDNKHYLDSIPSEYITQAELSSNSYLTQHQDLSNYPTYSYVNRTFSTYSYLSENYLPLSGGYMTGALIIRQAPGGLPNGAYSLTFKQNINSMANFHIGAESTGDLTISYSIVNDSNTPTRIMSLARRSDGSIVITPYGEAMDKNISWGAYTSSKHRQFKDFYTYNMYLDGIDIHTLFPSYSYVINYVDSYFTQPDWNITNSSYTSYIANKPKIYSTTYSTNVGRSNNVIYDKDITVGSVSSSKWRITNKTSNSITIQPGISFANNINFADKGDLIYINNDDVNYVTSVQYTTSSLGWNQCVINLKNSIVNWDSSVNHIKICTADPEKNTNILSNVAQHIAQNQYNYTQGDTIIGNGLPYLDPNHSVTHLLCVGAGPNPSVKYTAFDIIKDGYYKPLVYTYGIGNFNGSNYSEAKDLAYVINNTVSYTYLTNTLNDYPTYSYVNEVFPTYSYIDDRINNIQQVVYQTIPIWKGTYTQYQNLPDYTSYELYLIKQE